MSCQKYFIVNYIINYVNRDGRPNELFLSNIHDVKYVGIQLKINDMNVDGFVSLMICNKGIIRFFMILH